MRQIPFYILLLISVLPGCKRSALPEKQNTIASTQTIAACDLLTKEDVAAIQGAQMTSATSKQTPFNEFLVSECYYSSSVPDMSVTVSIIQSDPGQKSQTTVIEYWHEKLDRFREKQETPDGDDQREADKQGHKPPGDGEEEEKERAIKLPHIDGIGDDAYWSGSKVGGTLYVLKGEKMLRISVGGPSDRQTKLEKSKALAQKVAERLPK